LYFSLLLIPDIFVIAQTALYHCTIASYHCTFCVSLHSILCSRAVSVCPSVLLSVTFLYCIKTSNHILILFSPSNSDNILVIRYQTLWQYSDGDPLTGASRFRPISGFGINDCWSFECRQRVRR